MAPEDLPILAGTTPKKGFLDSHEPRNHTGEKEQGGERGEKKKGLLALIIFILPTLEIVSERQKVLATHRSDTSTERYRFQKSGYIILAHFMPIYTRIFENGTARLRCPSGVSRALFCRSETISKVGNIKIMSASSPFFFSPLSPPFSFLSRVVSRLLGVQKTLFRCRSGQNGQIFRSHLFKNPGRYCKQLLSDGQK